MGIVHPLEVVSRRRDPQLQMKIIQMEVVNDVGILLINVTFYR